MSPHNSRFVRLFNNTTGGLLAQDPFSVAYCTESRLIEPPGRLLHTAYVRFPKSTRSPIHVSLFISRHRRGGGESRHSRRISRLSGKRRDCGPRLAITIGGEHRRRRFQTAEPCRSGRHKGHVDERG